MSKNIYIIGFMASGKTMYGQKLAKYINYNFIDLDNFIEKKHQQSIAQIFTEKGEAYFREIEKQALDNTFVLSKTVISLGGGTPCFFENLNRINQHGISIYFKANADILSSRLTKNKGKRPLIEKKTHDEIKEYVDKLLGIRDVFYKQAQLTCDATNINIQTLAKALEPLL